MTERPRLLLIEDDRDSREMYQCSLAIHGYDVAAAMDAPSALAALNGPAIDGIVTDYTLPGTDGLSLARLFRADPRTADVAILLLSGHRLEGLVPHTSICDATLVKPVLPDELAEAIQAAMARRIAARLDRGSDPTP